MTLAEKGVGGLAKAQVVATQSGLQLRSIDEMYRFAQMVAGSALAPKDFVGKPDSVIVAIQMGMEVGLPPMAALQNIAVINGRPSVWGDAQLAIVRATGCLAAFEETETNNDIEPLFRELCFEEDVNKRKLLKIQIAKAQANINKKADDYGVSCFVRREGFSEAFSRFTVSDAKTAGLWGKQGPWSQYPFRMLKARARSFLLRDQFGDALKGLMSREEAGDIVDVESHVSAVPAAEVGGGAPPPPPITRRRRQTQIVGEVRDLQQDDPHNNYQQTAQEVQQENPAVDSASAPQESGVTSAETTEQSPAPTTPAETASPSQKTEPVSTAPAAAPVELPPVEAFAIPPTNVPAGWLPSLDPDHPEDVLKSLSEWAGMEEIHPDEILFIAVQRGIAKKGQKLSELATSKLIQLVKAREPLRVAILKMRAGVA